MTNGITYIGQTNWRNTGTAFGIRDSDRMNHIYCLGKTGAGKSTLLLNMALSDIKRGNGIAVIDPHGDLTKTILNYVPQQRIKDVVYFAPADIQFPIPFNPLANINKAQHHLAVSGLIGIFKRIWMENWGPRLEHILRFCLLTLLEYEKGTLLDIQSLLTNEVFRNTVLEKVKSRYILHFWYNEFGKYSPAFKAEAIAPILNKMGLFQASEILRNTVGHSTQTWSMKEVMEEKKIFIANLSKGQLGEEASSLLGSMLINTMQVEAQKRVSMLPEARIPFYLYIDEAHSFLSLAVVDILAEARKFGLSLFLTHQYIEQLDERIRSAVFGNVGTLLSFRVGSLDAVQLAREFFPVFSENDLLTLPRYHMYLKLMIDGSTSKPFSAVTCPLPPYSISYHNEIIEYSRKRYAVNACNESVAENSVCYKTNPPLTLFQ